YSFGYGRISRLYILQGCSTILSPHNNDGNDRCLYRRKKWD
ncbi:chorismate synthase, partial [Chlamydia psittaci 03DC29]